MTNKSISTNSEQLHLIFSKVPFGVMAVGLDRNIRWVNQAVCSMMGVSDVRELIGCKCGDIFCLPAENKCPVLDLGQTLQNSERTLIRKDGGKVPVIKTVERIEFDGEEVLLETFVDITERKRVEEEQALAIQRMESLLALHHIDSQPMESIIAAVVEDAIRVTKSEIGYLATLNEDETVLTMRYWSKSAHAACKIVDKPIYYRLEDTGLWGEAARQRKPIITNDYAAPIPHKRGTPEGHVPITRHMNVPVFHGRQIVALAGVGNKPTDYNERDMRQLQLLMEGWWQIVMRKRAEEEIREYAAAMESNNKALEEFNQIAESATQAKNQFLANMSHEIRTPMTAVLGFTDILLRELEDPKLIEAAQIIKRNGENLLHLINDILDISKIEAGRMNVEKMQYSPKNIVTDVISLMQVRADAKGLMLVSEFAGPVPQTIMTDPARLRQILVNLIGNAVKFTENGEVRIKVALSGKSEDEPMLRFDVTDTGIGIPENEIENVFEPFLQVDNSASRKFKGTGLGLTISRQLARALGGDVTAKSELGKGSAFSVSIPTGSLAGIQLLEYSNEPDEECEQLQEHILEPMPKINCNVLLAEDIPDNQRLIASILREAGADVAIAEDGREAFELALAAHPGWGRRFDDPKKPFDVVLMDIQMPALDGYEVTRRLRAEGYKVPIIALTALAMPGDREKCVEAGCDGCLIKPVHPIDLLNMVAKWTNSSEKNAVEDFEKQPDGSDPVEAAISH